MHQQIDEESREPTKKEKLLHEKYKALASYRAAVRWACNALEYKRRFEREEDFGEDELSSHIDLLKNDARRELKSIAMDIKVLRKKIDNIDEKLMNLSKESSND